MKKNQSIVIVQNLKSFNCRNIVMYANEDIIKVLILLRRENAKFI